MLVESALIDEVTLSPKPGLVDVRGNGAQYVVRREMIADFNL